MILAQIHGSSSSSRTTKTVIPGMISLDLAAKVAMGDCALKCGRKFVGWVRDPKPNSEDGIELAERGLAPDQMAKRLARLEGLLGVNEEICREVRGRRLV
ncbi:uncharacterized protein FFB14_09596 [Fusarium fujikuroi]|nr:uncharacterized protein FFB14_09596 [Fusarium fujikuroi]